MQFYENVTWKGQFWCSPRLFKFAYVCHNVIAQFVYFETDIVSANAISYG